MVGPTRFVNNFMEIFLF